MSERPNFIQRQVDGFIDNLIVIRQSGEHFFGVQTVLASLIDRLAQKRAAHKPVSEKLLDEEMVAKYNVKTLF